MNLRERIKTAGIARDSEATTLGRILINSCVSADLSLQDFVESIIDKFSAEDTDFAKTVAKIEPAHHEERFNLAVLALDSDLAASIVGAEPATLENFDAIPVKYRKSIFESDDGGDFTKFEALINDQVAAIRAAKELHFTALKFSEPLPEEGHLERTTEVISVLSPAAVKMKEVAPISAPVPVKEEIVPAVKSKTPAELLHAELLSKSPFYYALQVGKDQVSLENSALLAIRFIQSLTQLQQHIAHIYCLGINPSDSLAAEKKAHTMAIAQLVGVIIDPKQPLGSVPEMLKPYFEGICNGTLKIIEAEDYQKRIRATVESGRVRVKVTQGIDWLLSPMDRYDAKDLRAAGLAIAGVKQLSDFFVSGKAWEETKLDSVVIKASESAWWSPSTMARIATGFGSVFSRLSPTLITKPAVSDDVLRADTALLASLQDVLRNRKQGAVRFATMFLGAEGAVPAPAVAASFAAS